MGRKRIDLDDDLTKEIDHIVDRFRKLGVKNASRRVVLKTIVDNFDMSESVRKPKSKTIFIKKKELYK